MILVLRRVSSNRRLLRKRIYKSPHSRHRNSLYYRENKNQAKPHQEEYRTSHAPVVKRKRRPKREVINGFKMSYRYKYYNDDVVEEDEIEEDLDE